ncbi:polysaccharide pyruvyl transferase family protein [Promicromonospora soli]|uniref:Exopolysaccharide biosynthesis protein n=1 Tax=Promicromonospora soli TaxID=2035533 RepID=A0A919KXJ0_9MICO|nr:polysaccharide pyruvyl transferase family protein [Promicromonospora soli]GHH76482.1 exopolysaccharide biosynthesis protein [Promicromonospora soli]
MTEALHRPKSLHEIRLATLEVLAEIIGTGRDVALLQAPNQRNVGDTLIWLGERKYFTALGLRLRHVSDLGGYDADAVRASLPEGGVVLIHGGGNFGDLWYGHQLHRERVTRDLPDLPIVQLPQSVYFASQAKAEQANTELGAHPDFTLLVRDDGSWARAAQQLPGVATRYCWDMALGWQPPQHRPARTARRPLLLARADKEAASGLGSVGLGAELGALADRADWKNSGPDAVAWHLLRVLPRLAHRVPALRRPAFQPLMRACIIAINAINVRGGVRLLRDRPLAVVDRLHAHILAGLLEVPHVALDNSYGKISAVYSEYTHVLGTARFASDLDDALNQARTLTAEEPA